MLISSSLIVQADEGVSLPVVDLIDESTAAYREEPVSLRFWLEPGACRQQGKWVYLVTNVMSLFDLRDVCMVIGSLATLDLPMVVDLIGIFVLKGPYCTLTMTNWFLQALSVIPMGSWGDVARRFTMIRWGPNCYFGLGGPENCFCIIMLSFVNCIDRSDLIVDRDYDEATAMDLKRMFICDWARPKLIKPVQAHEESIYRALGLALKTHTITLDFFLSSPHSPHAAAASLPSPPATDVPPSDLFRPSRRGASVREIFVVFSSADRRRNRESSRGPD
ncbi:hypothetical protein F511_20185 [Dorcoceras hygrometricum]|uniref:Uncharacterized protein n=1 Tax=Dorcoceras hygrometricum TaxID=472368 RepID=A0A2Z7DFR7_9LAMI|nr:hypothetical protein F511_20185 [Dorcoceras hygrometricum]